MIADCITNPGSEECSIYSLLASILCVAVSLFDNFIYNEWRHHRRPSHTPKGEFDPTQCCFTNIKPEANTGGRKVCTIQHSEQISCGSTDKEPETNADGKIFCMIQGSDQTSCGSTDVEPEINTDGRILCKIQHSDQRFVGSTDVEPETNTDGRIHCKIQDTGDVKRDYTGTETADGSIHVFPEDSNQKLVDSKSVKCGEGYNQVNLKRGKKMRCQSKNNGKNFVKRCDIAISFKAFDQIASKIFISVLNRVTKFELAGLVSQVSYIILLEDYVTLKIVTNLPDIKCYKPKNSKNFSNGEAIKINVSQSEEMSTDSMSTSAYDYRKDNPSDLSFRGDVRKGCNSTCLEKVSRFTCVEIRLNSTCIGKRSSSSWMKHGFNSSSGHYVDFLAWNSKEMWRKLIGLFVGPREIKNLREIVSLARAPLTWIGVSKSRTEDLKAKNSNSHYVMGSMFWKEKAKGKVPAICYPLSHGGPVNSVARETGDRKEKEVTSTAQAREVENKESLLPTDDINDASGCHGEGESTHSLEEEENQGNYLFEACVYCIQDTIDSVVQSDVSLSNTRKTALMCAVSRKHTECLRAFLHEGADINEADHKGRTAVMLASMTEHCTSCLYFLIMKGASLDKADNEGLTALMHAARKGFLEYVVILVAAMTNGSSPESEIPKLALMNGMLTDMLTHIPVLGKDHPILNATDKQHKTALIHALENEFIDCVQVFVKAGADVNKADFRGKSPVMILLTETPNLLDHREISKSQLEDLLVEQFFNCSLSHHLKTISFLLEAGADINQADHQGNTPLIQAVRAQDIQCCHLLLLRGAAVNMRNNERRTAFMYAARNVNTDMMKTLMAFGAEINLQDNNQQTGLMIVIHSGRSMSRYLYSGRNTSIKAVKFLVENGADLSARDKNGETALVTGVKNGQSLQCLQIISDKQSIDLPDNNGMTALIHCLKLRTEEDVINYASFLLELGANPVIESQFRYLLHPRNNSQQSESKFHMEFFLEHEHFEMVRLLVSNGIVHSAAAAYGVRYVGQPSLSIVALLTGHIEVAKYLIASSYLMDLDLNALGCLRVQCLSGQCTLKNEGIRLVEQATSQPWPLGKLSFIVVSSAIGHGPRREERIRQTGLPVRLQEMLLFETPVSRIPVSQWAEIKLRFDTVEHKRWPLLYYWPFDVDKNKIKDVF